MKEQELQTLREQMSSVQKELLDSKHTSLEQISALRAEVSAAKRKPKLMVLRDKTPKCKCEKPRRASVRPTPRSLPLRRPSVKPRACSGGAEQIGGHQTRLQDALKIKDSLEKQLQASATKHQDLEDALLELERRETNWKHKADQVAVELSAESKRRELLEQAHKQAERTPTAFNSSLPARTRRSAVSSTSSRWLSKRAQAAVDAEQDHRRACPRARRGKKYTDRQLADAQSKLQELAHYTKTLEKSKTRLANENEDLTREITRLQRANGGVASSPSVGNGLRSSITTYGNVAPSPLPRMETPSRSRSLKTRLPS